MKKYRSFAFVFIILMICSLTSCVLWIDRFYDEMDEYQPEVDYKIVYIDEYDKIEKDNIIYDCEEYAKEIIKQDIISIRDRLIDGNGVYFFCKYNERETSDEEDATSIYDVALFKFNVENLSCDLLYDVKDVSFFKFDIKDNRALMCFNGAIHILDINKKEIVKSYDYIREGKKEKVGFDNYNDFYVIYEDSVLDYYELVDYDFIIHRFEKFENLREIYINRYENYIYSAYSDIRDIRYKECFDLLIDEKIEPFPKDIKDALEAKRLEDYEKIITVNDQKYIVWENGYTFIYDEDNNLVKTIDDSFFEENEAYVNLEKHGFNMAINFVIDNKLFIGFTTIISPWGAISRYYIFEYDLLTDTPKYVGSVKNCWYDKIILYE